MKQNTRKCIGVGCVVMAFFFFARCTTIGTHQVYLEGEPPQTGKLVLRDVKVSVDHADDIELAWQVRQTILARALNLFVTARGDEPVYALDIAITQRSYIEKLAIKNSIYASITVFDREENPVAMGIYYEDGKRSFISAKVQYYIIGQLIHSILNNSKNK
ncbi:MAG: hypothetical protein LBQ88_15120 [Treponema sp.]|jgi:hypothetical protein|nr:hypothetical protein [Treponema sp.]